MKKSRKNNEEPSRDGSPITRTSRANFDHFGILAPFYEFFIPPRTSPEFLEMVHPPQGGIILDAGGGTGRVAQFLQPDAKMVVVADESFTMLREARKKAGLEGICAAAENLPFAPLSFDRVVMVDALHHVANQAYACDELWRIVKPDGRIVIEEPDIRSFWVKLIALAEKLAMMRSRFLQPSQIAALFQHKDASVRIVDVKGTALIAVDRASVHHRTPITKR